MSLPSVCVVASTTVLNGLGCDDDANKNCRGEAGGEFDGGGGRRGESEGGGGRARPSNSTGGCHGEEKGGELDHGGPGRDIAPVPADGRELVPADGFEQSGRDVCVKTNGQIPTRAWPPITPKITPKTTCNITWIQIGETS